MTHGEHNPVDKVNDEESKSHLDKLRAFMKTRLGKATAGVVGVSLVAGGSAVVKELTSNNRPSTNETPSASESFTPSPSPTDSEVIIPSPSETASPSPTATTEAPAPTHEITAETQQSLDRMATEGSTEFANETKTDQLMFAKEILSNPDKTQGFSSPKEFADKWYEVNSVVSNKYPDTVSAENTPDEVYAVVATSSRMALTLKDKNGKWDRATAEKIMIASHGIDMAGNWKDLFDKYETEAGAAPGDAIQLSAWGAYPAGTVDSADTYTGPNGQPCMTLNSTWEGGSLSDNVCYETYTAANGASLGDWVAVGKP